MSKDDVIGQQEADIVRIYDSKIITYEDLDVDFAEHQFGAGWYAFKVRALGDGTAFLNGEWSPEVKVYRLPEILQGGNTIDLDYDVSLSPGLGIEDSLGSEIKFDVTELSWNDTNDNGVFTFQLEEEKSEDISYGLYIDGILKASGTITTKGPHTLEISELSPGKHTVVFILRNENEANSIGSYIYILNVSYDSNTDITVE